MMKLPEKIDQRAADQHAPCLNVLVADADPLTATLVRQSVDPALLKLRAAVNADATHLEMKREPADVLFVNLQIDDNAGVALIRAIKSRWPRTQIIAVSRLRRPAHAAGNLAAGSNPEPFSAGASDLLEAPILPADVHRALRAVAARQSDMDRLEKRNARLRVACRRLNKARHEISQQVDLLCNDLVRAYQDMAQQLNVTQTAADYANALRAELDIEGILRRSMEWLLQKLGPVNAAVYLPAGEELFALGAYLNLDTKADAALIETLARTIVQQARGTTSLVLDDNRQLHELFGDDANLLRDRAWLATGCQTPRQCIAVLVIFRKQSDDNAAESSTRALMDAIAPVLADRIEQALGFHHRLHPFTEEDNDTLENS